MSESSSAVSNRVALSSPSRSGYVLDEQISKAAVRVLRASRCALALAVLSSVTVSGQSPSLPKAQQGLGAMTHGSSESNVPIGEQEAFRAHKLLALLNAERQKSMVSDANKLLRLAQELNAELARDDSGLSSSQQAHKAAQIEKLARNVREKMSFAVGGNSVIDSPFSVMRP